MHSTQRYTCFLRPDHRCPPAQGWQRPTIATSLLHSTTGRITTTSVLRYIRKIIMWAGQIRKSWGGGTGSQCPPRFLRLCSNCMFIVFMSFSDCTDSYLPVVGIQIQCSFIDMVVINNTHFLVGLAFVLTCHVQSAWA